jgi:hypothetical protein
LPCLIQFSVENFVLCVNPLLKRLLSNSKSLTRFLVPMLLKPRSAIPRNDFRRMGNGAIACCSRSAFKTSAIIVVKAQLVPIKILLKTKL